jgi:hypothetical protein
MRVSNPRNSHKSGERVIAFEVDVDGKVVSAEITCEAVLKKASAEITESDEKAALEQIKRDHEIAYKVAELFRGGHPGDAGLPIFLSTTNYR